MKKQYEALTSFYDSFNGERDSFYYPGHVITCDPEEMKVRLTFGHVRLLEDTEEKTPEQTLKPEEVQDGNGIKTNNKTSSTSGKRSTGKRVSTNRRNSRGRNAGKTD